MRLIRGLHNIRPSARGGVATIGNFDGVHCGHQAMLQRLRDRAAEFGGPSTVISFEPHPREFFSPEEAPGRLTPLRDKVAILTRLGCDQLLCLPFNRKLASLDAEAFIGRVLVDGLGIRHLIVGDDFRFGRGRCGDFQVLAQAGAVSGFSVEDTPTVDDAGGRVSSTRISEALSRGDLAVAERLLGRPYVLSGRVINGDRIGRDLGFPTANIALPRRPAMEGIVVVDVRLPDGEIRPGVASLGTRPTVNGTRPLLEVYLLDWSGNLYGLHLQVALRHWLRGQEHYPDLNALKQQIARDVENSRAWFAARQQTAGHSVISDF